jgi:protein-tyrosine phosphatase
MAEAIFNKFAPDGFSASSAGLSCTDGKPVSENSIIALSEIDISVAHLSVMVNPALMNEYDMIIGITENHAKALLSAFPEQEEKIYAFPVDVGDPYGQNIDAYRICREMIYNGVKIIINKIKNG